MKPILFPAEEMQYDTNGICRLVDCVSCDVTEERNGKYEVEFKYPITGRYYSEIKEGLTILCRHDETTDLQPFDIYARSAPIDGLVTFNARHVSYRLSHSIVQPYSAANCALAFSRLPSHCVGKNIFTFWTDKNVEEDFKVEYPKSVRSVLMGEDGSILDVFGTGEYEFDRFAVRLYTNRGQNTDVTIRYGKNLADITHEYDISETYSGIQPYWVGSEDDDGNKDVVVGNAIVYGEPKQVKGTVWTAVGKINGEDTAEENVVDENGEPIDIFYGMYDAVPMDMSSYFSEKPDQKKLKEQANELLWNTKPWEPEENIEVDFVAMWQSPEYENVASLQRVRLCDTVSVYYPQLGVVAEKMQVIKVVYDCLLERYSSMELGKPKATYSDAVQARVEQAIKTAKLPTKSYITMKLEEATNSIRGAYGGHVVIPEEQDQILIMDTDDISTCRYCIRMNQAGIGFSTTGYNGPFNSAWTIDGTLNMQEINVINLTANLIRGGTLTLGSEENVSGLLELYDSSNKLVGRLDKNGLMMFGTDGSYVLMNNEVGFAGYDRNGTKIYWVARDEFHMKKSSVEEEITICNKMRFIPITRSRNGAVVSDGVGIVAVGSVE